MELLLDFLCFCDLVHQNYLKSFFHLLKNVVMSKYTILFLFFLGYLPIISQAQHVEEEYLHGSIHSVEERIPPFRVAVLIGHTLIPDEHSGEEFFIPSWGLDLEYWFNKEWGIGLHSDLEIETFVLVRENAEQDELERQSPLVLTLDALFKPWKGLVFQVGPGIEIERSENFPLLRLGLEYEFELPNHWDIAPSFFYDNRFGAYHTWSIALGVGKRF